MGISSLGAGSSILTQDVIDQLRVADESKYVAPIDSKMKAEKDKVAAFDVLEAYADNVYESLKSLTEFGVFESRVTNVDDEDIVDVSAVQNSDIQDFTLEVTSLATKQIEQSGQFSDRTDTIANGKGSLELKVGDETFTIDYESTTTLDGLKELIEKEAGDKISATVVQVAEGDFRLLFSAKETGTGQAITITDNDDHLAEQLQADTDTTDGMSNVQTAVDAEFKFNGLDITRKSNVVDDLLTGVKITLKDVGTTDVSVKQDRGHIEEKVTNFIDKYNSVMFQLDTDTKSSQDADDRGAFSGDATMKRMRMDFKNVISTVGGAGGSMQDFGIKIEDDGRLSLDSTLLNSKLDKDPEGTQNYFTGGTFTKSDGSTTELSGIFTELEDKFSEYSKRGSILDKYQDSMDIRTKSLTEQ